MGHADLLLLIQTYAAHEGLTPTTAVKRAGAHARLATRLAAGHGCTIRVANSVIAWFDAHWPAGAAWPQDVPRPSAGPVSAPGADMPPAERMPDMPLIVPGQRAGSETPDFQGLDYLFLPASGGAGAPDTAPARAPLMRSPAPNHNFPVCLPADAAAAGKPPGPRGSSLRAGRDRLVRLSRRLNDSPLGDAIGAGALFAILISLLFLGA